MLKDTLSWTDQMVAKALFKGKAAVTMHLKTPLLPEFSEFASLKKYLKTE